MLQVGLGLDGLAIHRPSERGATLDFARGQYRRAGVLSSSFTGLPGTTFSRTGAGTAFHADGRLAVFASGVPRITDRGLLVEAARTNLSPWSWTTSNAGWVAFAGTKTAGQADPSGGAGAALYVADGTASTQHVIVGPDLSVTSGTTYVLSALVKAGTADRVQATMPNTRFGGVAFVNYHLSGAGSVSQSGGTLVGSGIQALGNGWYRVWYAATATSTGTTGGFGLRPLVTGTEARAASTTTGGSFAVVGLQVEAGTTPSSPILTGAAAATRGADAASVTVPAGCTAFVAIHGEANSETRGPAVAGAVFDLATSGPWVGTGLKTLILR